MWVQHEKMRAVKDGEIQYQTQGNSRITGKPMKKSKVLTLTAFFVLAFAMAASAQVPAAGGKIAVINSELFSMENGGITKYVNAIKGLNLEFAPVQKELETLGTRLRALEAEIKTGTEAIQRGSAVDRAALDRKREEYDRILRDYKFKEEDARSRYSRRSEAVRSPLNLAIGNALNEYGKQKGYAIIFDISKDTTGLIVALPDEKIDITKDFIAFFNAKP